MSEPNVETLQKAFANFTDELLRKYFGKFKKHGDSWLTCDKKILKDHIARHSIHLQTSDYGMDQLAGMGLLCMFLIYRKREDP